MDNVTTQIKNYISYLPDAKQVEIEKLHYTILELQPYAQLWFLDGKNELGKVVSNPNIGYGTYTIEYKDGTSKEFYRVGISANTSGISVYIMGLKDKNLLKDKFGDAIGKADVTGYCIKFKSVSNINMDVLKEIINYRFESVN